MRKRLLASLVLLAVLSAPQALACSIRADAPPPPTVFWSSPPEQVAPDEFVLIVEFVEEVRFHDPQDPRVVIFISCGPPEIIYRVTQSIAGIASPGDLIVMRMSFAPPEPDRTLILVGRLTPQAPASPGARYALDIDPTIPRLEPRLPPQ